MSVSAMVHKFKDTKLSSVALKSDKVRANNRELSSDLSTLPAGMFSRPIGVDVGTRY